MTTCVPDRVKCFIQMIPLNPQKISLLINYNYTHFIVKYTETYTNVIIAIHCNVGKWESNSGTKTFLMVNSRLTDIPQ